MKLKLIPNLIFGLVYLTKLHGKCTLTMITSSLFQKLITKIEMFSKVIFSRGSIRNKTSDLEFSVVFSETEITQQEDQTLYVSLQVVF